MKLSTLTLRITYLLVVIGAFGVSTLPVFSQKFKVLETSGKRPAWLGLTERKYLIVSAHAPTLEDAKEHVLRSLREQIISSVAVNVQSSTQMSITNTNGVSNEQMTVKIKSKAANLSFIQGISLSKAEGSYWEKVRYEDGRIVYGMHVRYPFSDADLQLLIEEFDKQQAEILNYIKLAEIQLDTLLNMTVAEQLVSNLAIYENQVFDDQAERVSRLKNLIMQRFAQGDVVVDNLVQDKMYIYFLINGIKAPLPAGYQIKCNCAKVVRTEPSGDGGYVLSLLDNSCVYETAPKLEVRYLFMQRETKVTAPFQPQAFTLKLSFEEPINIRTASISGNVEAELMFRSNQNEFLTITALYIYLKNGSKLTADQIQLTKTTAKWSLRGRFATGTIPSASQDAFPSVKVEVEGTFGPKKTPFVKKADNLRYSTDY